MDTPWHGSLPGPLLRACRRSDDSRQDGQGHRWCEMDLVAGVKRVVVVMRDRLGGRCPHRDDRSCSHQGKVFH